MNSKIFNLFNGLSYTVGWFVCVLGGVNHLTFFPILYTVIVVSLQLYIPKKDFVKNVRLLFFGTSLGFFMEIAYLSLGVLEYPTINILYPYFPPGWIWCLYFLFSMTLNYSLRFLNDSLVYAFLFGAIGGPICYYAGVKLDAVTLLLPQSLMIVSLFLGTYLTLVVQFNRKFNVC